MLKLKKVELLGFKSFRERTTMHFNGGGITGVVGPNGCGKSNLSDAISWVLGEQSARLLRGTRMEDVIFNGTRERKPLGMASVTMTLVDPEFFFHAPEPTDPGSNGHHRNGEITVTRRLFRSGESEYLLNGEQCRLRDIQEIFMGTGLGPECYAIIEQGRIGQILSSRPYDRRAVIEEAAGITKFKTKKKLAETKLESAKQNLARVIDILEEVSRQAQSLKRQAAKARRYGELRAEMTAKLTLVLGGRHRRLEQEAVQTALDLNLAGEQLRQQSARVEQLEAEHSSVQQESFDLEQRLQQRREELSAAAVESERSRQKADYQARLAEENGGRISRAEGELATVEGRIRELERELVAEQATGAALAQETESGRASLQAKSEELGTLQLRIHEQEGELERLRQSVLGLLGEVSDLRNQMAQIEEFLAGLERQAARTRDEETVARQEVATLTGEKQSLQARLDRQRAEIIELEQRRRGIEDGIARSKPQVAARREAIEALKTDISRLQARRESLEEILSHRAYTTDTVKNLFAALEQGRLGDFRARGILADFVEVDAAYEKAVEEFLREELEYVVVESWAAAEQGLGLLRAETEGHATFLVQPKNAAAPEIAHLGPEASELKRLRDYVRFTDGLGAAGAAVLLRLARCYLAADAEQARNLARRYPELFFLFPDGAWYHGHTLSGGRKTSSGPLALKRELRELAPRLAASARALESETRALADLDEAIQREWEELEALRAQLQEAEKGVLATEHETRQLHDRLEQAGARASVARLELERLNEEAARARQERDRNQSEVDEREAARRAAEEALAAVRQQIGALQADASRASDEQAEWRARLAALDERCKAALASAARLEQMLAEETGRRGELARQIDGGATERDRLREDNRRLAAELARLAERQKNLEGQAQELAATLEDRRGRLVQIEELLKTLKLEQDATRERRSAIEIQLVRLQSDLKHLEETCQHELGSPIAEVAAAADPTMDPEAAAAAEEEYLRLKEKIEAMGPINALALEEYEEAQQRFEFLDTQRADLVDSIRDTQQAIQEIDGVSRRKFLEAFEQINKNFRETFTTLFGGGTGEMRLTDETNLAESGIDIVASPPGKKLQNVLLLSGGEKALTAIALLMAVFRYQPSPFCILDEVDAPLDEPNIVRFTRLIREMSEQTQFVLITHNRTTMEVAESLYGVTMQEPGVSRLVSVRLAEGVPPTETFAETEAELTAASA